MERIRAAVRVFILGHGGILRLIRALTGILSLQYLRGRMQTIAFLLLLMACVSALAGRIAVSRERIATMGTANTANVLREHVRILAVIPSPDSIPELAAMDRTRLRRYLSAQAQAFG
jgi:hypothetical protein